MYSIYQTRNPISPEQIEYMRTLAEVLLGVASEFVAEDSCCCGHGDEAAVGVFSCEGWCAGWGGGAEDEGPGDGFNAVAAYGGGVRGCGAVCEVESSRVGGLVYGDEFFAEVGDVFWDEGYEFVQKSCPVDAGLAC